jgi:polyhydroxyalkanoate synthase
MALQADLSGLFAHPAGWYNATTGIEGVSRQHENMVEFTTQQILDMVSPSNFVFTNPVVLQTTLSQYG